jgi:hypothetical protein
VPQFTQVVSFGTDHALIEKPVGYEQRLIVAIRDI